MKFYCKGEVPYPIKRPVLLLKTLAKFMKHGCTLAGHRATPLLFQANHWLSKTLTYKICHLTSKYYSLMEQPLSMIIKSNGVLHLPTKMAENCYDPMELNIFENWVNFRYCSWSQSKLSLDWSIILQTLMSHHLWPSYMVRPLGHPGTIKYTHFSKILLPKDIGTT